VKRFGETLLKGTMIWCHNLEPDPINSLTIPADSSIKARVGGIEAMTRKPNASRAEQRENKMLRGFAPHSLMERIGLPPVSANWAAQPSLKA